MEYLKLSTILLFCFLLRLIFIITPTTDVYAHLWHIKKHRLYGFGKHNVFKSIFEGIKGYPSLPHYFLSHFSEKNEIRTGYLLNILYDCMSVFFIYVISKILFAKILIPSTSFYIEPHFIATILYGTCPILLPYTSRLKSFGGRTFGNLINLIYFASLGLYLISNNYFFLTGSICSGVLILLSSQFGMQVMVLFSIFIAIFYLNVFPVLTVGLVFCIGTIFPGLGVRGILKHRINHYLWYKKNYSKGTTASGRNRLIDILRYPIYFFSDPNKFFELTFKKLSLIIAAFSLPTFIFLLYFVGTDYSRFLIYWDNDILRYLFAVSFSSFIIFGLVSLKWLSFIGEAERYFEYSIGAIIILFVFYCFKLSYFGLLFFMIIFHICIIMLNFMASLKRLIKNAVKLENDTNFIQLMEFINSSEHRRILSIPTKLSFKISLYSKEIFEFYYQFVTEKEIDGFQRQQEDELLYNFIKPDFDYFIQKYRIDTFVIQKKALKKSKREHKINYVFTNLKLVFQNEEYLIYQ